jgi:1-acyl-sn-glycerol-3-phosphate acyltransferase
VHVDGRFSGTPCVYLSNHRSYLDIPMLGGVLGACFLSRADVESWTVIGASARAIGTVFIDRDDPGSRVRAARALARRVRSHSIIVFPEGTTGGDRLPQPFAGGLFRLLGRLRVPIVPVTIRYSDRRAYWIDQRTIAEHLKACLTAQPRVTASVHVGAPLASATYPDPDELAAAAYGAVCAPIHALGELAGTGPA